MPLQQINAASATSEWKMLAHKEFQRRRNKVCLNLHKSLCRKRGYNASDRWYNHVPEKVINEAGKPKIIWNFDI